MLKELKHKIKSNKNSEKAKKLARFFKTGKGEYGEGDKFWGITAPILRKLVKPYYELEFSQLKILIQSSIHEERSAALFILITKYQKAKEVQNKKSIYDFYCSNMRYVNSWDLVDLSAPHIIGHYLFEREKTILDKWAKSKNLWQRRIAIISTFYFIRQNDFVKTLEIAETLLADKEDLIHKAVGWMLREVGKRDLKSEENFLKKHYMKMPRTMLRYAIERFPENRRMEYLKHGVQGPWLRGP